MAESDAQLAVARNLWRQTRIAEAEAVLSEPMLATLRDFIGAPARESDAVDADAPVQSASLAGAPADYTISLGRWRRYAPYVPELAQFGGSD